MAFGSEIRFKIGGDTSALSSAFTKAQSLAAQAGQQITKKLGFKDAFRGIMQGIGIGSVQGITELVVRPFELGAERAKTLLGLTSKLREITTNEIVQTGGRQTALKEKAREANDLNREIEISQKLVNDLNDDPLTFVNQDAFAMLKEAEQELANLTSRQAQLFSEISIDQKNAARAVEETANRFAESEHILEAQLRNASEREQLQIRMNDLLEEEARIRKREGKDSAAANAIFLQRSQVGGQMRLLDKKAKEDRQEHLVSLGQSAVGGRTFANGAPRPRSETERIAARGAASLKRAEDEAMGGGDAAFVARLTRSANRDLGTAGQRIAKASSGVDKDASLQGIKSELVNANKTLEQIEKNLEPEDIDE